MHREHRSAAQLGQRWRRGRGCELRHDAGDVDGVADRWPHPLPLTNTNRPSDVAGIAVVLTVARLDVETAAAQRR